MRSRAGRVLPFSGALIVSLALSILPFVQQAAVAAPIAPGSPTDTSVPVANVLSKAATVPTMPETQVEQPVWPSASSAVVDLPDSGVGGLRAASAPQAVGGLPVVVEPVLGEGGDMLSARGVVGAVDQPSKVSVDVLDHAESSRLGGQVVLRVARADGDTGPAKVRVKVDYSAFEQGFGAAWKSRARLLQVPACALTAGLPTDRDRCRVRVLASDNQPESGTISAEVDLASAGAAAMTAEGGVGGGAAGDMVMLAASASSDAGSFAQTDVKPSSSWAAGGSSGDFTYSYPVSVPPVPGGMTPTVSLDYSAQSVDGQTSTTNTQSSWIGQGWDYSPGSIDRTTRVCAEDIDHTRSYNMDAYGDPCWRYDNYQMNLAGHSGELVPTANPNVWKLAGDDGSYVEHIPAATGNGMGVGEKWRLVTSDGTQWWFGKQQLPGWTSGQRTTNSVLSSEVLANQNDDRCYNGADFWTSRCHIPYRWMLDYVVDARGNSMSYWYTLETNNSGLWNLANGVINYDRAATLTRIEYGTRAGSETTGTAPAKVEFTAADRCFTNCWSGSTPNAANWRDTPWDLQCTASPCTGNLSQSFWTSKRLSKITTSVWNGTAYTPVDEWALDHHGFPGVSSHPSLWLYGITHTGLVGGTAATPSMAFYGVEFQQKASADGGSDQLKFRMTTIINESGGRIDISYRAVGQGMCSGSGWPDPDNNADLCFPELFQGNWVWWHKYLVDKVTASDALNVGTVPIETSYTYLISGTVNGQTVGSTSNYLWGYTRSVWGTINKSWNNWKGFPVVMTLTGAAGSTRTKTVDVYYRGFDEDRTDAGDFARDVKTIDSTGATTEDHRALAGMLREHVVYTGAGGTEISREIHDPQVTQTGGGTLPSWQWPAGLWSYMAKEKSVTGLTKLADGTWRTTKTVNTWDTTYGTLSKVDAQGDTGVSTDDTCTTYTYIRNIGAANLISWPVTSGSVDTSNAVVIGTDFSGWNNLFSPGDFNGDGKSDIIGRYGDTLTLFPGNGAGGAPTGWTTIGSGFNGYFDQLFSPGDFNGDGKTDIMAHSTDGRVLLYPGNGTGGVSSAIEIRTGMTTYDRFIGGDFTGDGKPDLVTRNTSTGGLWLYPGNGTGGLTGTSTNIGAGWQWFDILTGGRDLTGDGKADIVARVVGESGMRLYAGNGNGTIGSYTMLADDYSDYDSLAVIPDFTGDSKADLIGRRTRVTWLTGLVSQTDTVGVNCSTTASLPADALGSTRTYYDKATSLTQAPSTGNPTKVETVGSYTGSTPNWITSATTNPDKYGRPLWVKDALGRQTSTSYTSTGGLLTSTSVTNAAGHTAVTTIDPTRGLPLTVTDANNNVTTGSYDPLGRLVKVWKDNRTSASTPNTEYAYSLSSTAPSYVTTKALGPNGNQIASHQIMDGLLRPIQTQTTAPDGMRTISDIAYNSLGQTVKTATYYNSSSAPSPTLVSTSDTVIDSQQRFTYDGAGRQVTAELWSRNALKWQTSTVYAGEKTTIIPPAGTMPSASIVDAAGQVVEKRQYLTSDTNGAFDKTAYAFDRKGQLTKVTDAVGNHWDYTYDLLGRKTQTVDPDAGTSSSTYDNAGQVLSTTDGRGQKLFFDYDLLGRKTAEHADTATGTVLASWVYDTVAKGQLTSSTRVDSGLSYTTAVGSYDSGYRPLSSTVTIPVSAANGALAGTYTTSTTYKANGAIDTQTMPGWGGLPAETMTTTYTTTALPATVSSGSATYVASTTYTFDGLLTQQVNGASGKQVKRSNAYDPVTRRLNTATSALETATVGVFADKYASDYTYDQTGNILSIAGKTDGTADQEECFQYDYLRRLTQAWTQTSGTCTTAQRTGADPYWRTWAFDKTGNRLTQVDKDPVAGDTTWTYTVGSAGSVTPHQMSKVDSVGPRKDTASRTFAYDLAGNTKNRTTEQGIAQTLTWDKEGHLATVNDGTNTTSYVYDATGNRLIGRTAAKTTLYLGTTELELSSGTVLGTRYYDGIAIRDAGGLKWTVVDHHGTGQAQIDAVTLAASRQRSLPYGEARGTQATGWTGTKGYVGGIKDTTGLTHLGAREYDQTIGRFTSIDPLFDLSDVQTWHGYSYADNAPIVANDSTGLTPDCGSGTGSSCGSWDEHKPLPGGGSPIGSGDSPLGTYGCGTGNFATICPPKPAAPSNVPDLSFHKIGDESPFGARCFDPGHYPSGCAAGSPIVECADRACSNYLALTSDGQCAASLLCLLQKFFNIAALGLLIAAPAVAAAGIPAEVAIGLPEEGGGIAVFGGLLSDDMALTFAGARYTPYILGEDTALFRAGVAGRPLGQFFSSDPPVGVLQTRIDKAIPLRWPTGQSAPLDTGYEILIPKGTMVFVGEVGNQGGVFVGGTQQIVVLQPWNVPGVKVVAQWPLK